MATDDYINKIRQLMKTEADKDQLLASGLPSSPPDDLIILIDTLPELDSPVIMVPDILAAGPTVYNNLGTYCLNNEHLAVETVKFLQTVFNTACERSPLLDIRVLWKRKQPLDASYSLEPKSLVDEILVNEIDDDLLRARKCM
ncbi:hypothetical protein BKA67DRAFT_538780 [Truncatella angustata]|uniref:Uncharacterized protein n=1 Tax=Truncatella angustata TaxID=152316 RepID=A0A9P8UF13_9PEZI|nr:uncharacterized protein BKA67DRAFT_538780 [Truncatella angustata]KAH6648767.1 hypothetical protein BKA67DRAFT_538780 [Truncatella angustata]